MAALLYKNVKNGRYTMEDIRTRFSHWYPQVKELWDKDHPEEVENPIEEPVEPVG